MGFYTLGLGIVIVLFVVCLWQLGELEERIEALEKRVDGPADPRKELGDLRNPDPEALRRAIDPARGFRNPGA